MASSGKMKWRTCIEIDGKKAVIAEGDENGNVTRYMSEEELRPYEDKIMENIGRCMSRYISAHPESALWDKT